MELLPGHAYLTGVPADEAFIYYDVYDSVPHPALSGRAIACYLGAAELYSDCWEDSLFVPPTLGFLAFIVSALA